MAENYQQLIKWIQGYVTTRLRTYKDAISTQIDHKNREMQYVINKLQETVNQQAAEISQLRQAVESSRMWDARLSRTEGQISDLDAWKKGAINQINTLINLEYERLDEISSRWGDRNVEANNLAKQVRLINQLSKPRASWVDGQDIGPLLDTHAERLPDSGTGHPNSLP